MAPTDRAMRAARAYFEIDVATENRFIKERVVPFADLIDRETGLPELLEQRSLMCVETGDLRRRLAAVEALHVGVQRPSPLSSPVCPRCACDWPCPTLRAARGLTHDGERR